MNATSTFPRRLEALQDVFDLAEGFFRDAGVPDAGRFPVTFALEELFTNMVRHNPGGQGDIRISLDYGQGEVRVELMDPDSDPFDLEADAPAVDLTLPLDQRQPGGLGIHLVKKLMDRIESHCGGRAATYLLFKRVG